MDYARFNYVAQPGDKGVKLTPPDLGPYDDYVIKYAYTPLPDKKDMFDEEKTIRGWIDEKVGDPIYRYGRQQVIARYDPTAIEEDLGDDHIKAGDYGIGNLKYVLSHMEEWITDEEDPDLKIRTELYEAAAGQFARYVNAVMLNVGGIYLTDVNSNTAGRSAGRFRSEGVAARIAEMGACADEGLGMARTARADRKTAAARGPLVHPALQLLPRVLHLL